MENGRSGFSERYAARTLELKLKDADVARVSGIPTSTLSRYRNGGAPNADHIFPLADALKCSARWLIAGAADELRIGIADEADWVEVPEFDLSQLNKFGKGAPISTTRFRRDWLNRAFGRDRGVWTAALPTSYETLSLNEGDRVICCDIAREELRERHLCIWRAPLFHQLLVARFSAFHRGNQIVVVEDGEYWINPHLVEGDIDEGTSSDVVPVGRILGRPLAPLR